MLLVFQRVNLLLRGIKHVAVLECFFLRFFTESGSQGTGVRRFLLLSQSHVQFFGKLFRLRSRFLVIDGPTKCFAAGTGVAKRVCFVANTPLQAGVTDTMPTAIQGSTVLFCARRSSEPDVALARSVQVAFSVDGRSAGIWAFLLAAVVAVETFFAHTFLADAVTVSAAASRLVRMGAAVWKMAALFAVKAPEDSITVFVRVTIARTVVTATVSTAHETVRFGASNLFAAWSHPPGDAHAGAVHAFTALGASIWACQLFAPWARPPSFARARSCRLSVLAAYAVPRASFTIGGGRAVLFATVLAKVPLVANASAVVALATGRAPDPGSWVSRHAREVFALLTSEALGAHALSICHALPVVQARLLALLAHAIDPRESFFAYAFTVLFVTRSVGIPTARLAVRGNTTPSRLARFAAPAARAHAHTGTASASSSAGQPIVLWATFRFAICSKETRATLASK